MPIKIKNDGDNFEWEILPYDPTVKKLKPAAHSKPRITNINLQTGKKKVMGLTRAQKKANQNRAAANKQKAQAIVINGVYFSSTMAASQILNIAYCVIRSRVKSKTERFKEWKTFEEHERDK